MMKGSGSGSGSHKKGGSRRKKGGSAMPSMSQMNKMYEEMISSAFKEFDLGLDEEDM